MPASFKRPAAIAATLCTAALTPAPASATRFFTQDYVCPIGGEKFRHESYSNHVRMGGRPDGKPYSMATMPRPIPVCPQNGLPMYRDFTPEELPRVEQLILDPDFTALEEETSYFRAAWLMDRLGDKDRKQHAFFLLMASWQADGEPQRKAAYQRAFIKAVDALPDASHDSDWISLTLYAANGWRELGEFKRARKSLTVARKAWQARQYEDLGKGAIEAMEKRLTDLETLIVRKDSASEPLDLLFPPNAANVCIDQLDREGKMDAACDTPGIKSIVTTMLENRNKTPEQSQAEWDKETRASREAFRKDRRTADACVAAFDRGEKLDAACYEWPVKPMVNFDLRIRILGWDHLEEHGIEDPSRDFLPPLQAETSRTNKASYYGCVEAVKKGEELEQGCYEYGIKTLYYHEQTMRELEQKILPHKSADVPKPEPLAPQSKPAPKPKN